MRPAWSCKPSAKAPLSPSGSLMPLPCLVLSLSPASRQLGRMRQMPAKSLFHAVSFPQSPALSLRWRMAMQRRSTLFRIHIISRHASARHKAARAECNAMPDAHVTHAPALPTECRAALLSKSQKCVPLGETIMQECFEGRYRRGLMPHAMPSRLPHPKMRAQSAKSSRFPLPRDGGCSLHTYHQILLLLPFDKAAARQGRQGQQRGPPCSTACNGKSGSLGKSNCSLYNGQAVKTSKMGSR